MPDYKYPFGYSGSPQGMGTMLTWDQMMQKTTVNKLHPEVRRRFHALIEKGASEGVPLGVGTGWRVQPPKKPGFAAPGNSYHEGFPANGVAGNALAIDTVPDVSWAWMASKAGAYGFVTFKNVNNEPWHIQPSEVPKSRNYATKCPPLQVFNLPGPPKPPDPAPVGKKKLMYALLQDDLGQCWGTNMQHVRYLYNTKLIETYKSMLQTFGYGTTPTKVKRADILDGCYGILTGGLPGNTDYSDLAPTCVESFGVTLAAAYNQPATRADIAIQEIRQHVKQLNASADDA